MNDEPTKTAAEAGSVGPTLFLAARRNTDRVLALIGAKFGPGTEWRRPCPECGMGNPTLNLAETVIASKPDLSPVWNPCPECSLRSRLKLAGVSANLLGATLDNWEEQTPADEPTLKKARDFARRPVGFLILSSPDFGNGKTHLAVGVLREFVRTKDGTGGARFVTQSEILRGIRRRYDDSRAEDPVRALGAAPFLVLDELGVSGGGRDEAPAIYDILGERYNERRPTVLTMNLSPDEFRGAIGARMASRLREATFAWADVHGPSFRAAKRTTYLKG